jgi:hypothetical protein
MQHSDVNNQGANCNTILQSKDKAHPTPTLGLGTAGYNNPRAEHSNSTVLQITHHTLLKEDGGRSKAGICCSARSKLLHVQLEPCIRCERCRHKASNMLSKQLAGL